MNSFCFWLVILRSNPYPKIGSNYLVHTLTWVLTPYQYPPQRIPPFSSSAAPRAQPSFVVSWLWISDSLSPCVPSLTQFLHLSLKICSLWTKKPRWNIMTIEPWLPKGWVIFFHSTPGSEIHVHGQSYGVWLHRSLNSLSSANPLHSVSGSCPVNSCPLAGTCTVRYLTYRGLLFNYIESRDVFSRDIFTWPHNNCYHLHFK